MTTMMIRPTGQYMGAKMQHKNAKLENAGKACLIGHGPTCMHNAQCWPEMSSVHCFFLSFVISRLCSVRNYLICYFCQKMSSHIKITKLQHKIRRCGD